MAEYHPAHGLTEAERDELYKWLTNGAEVRRRRDAYRRAHPFTPAMRIAHISAGMAGHQDVGSFATTLEERGFIVDWDTIVDDETPFVATWIDDDVVVVEPFCPRPSGMTRWRGSE